VAKVVNRTLLAKIAAISLLVPAIGLSVTCKHSRKYSTGLRVRIAADTCTCDLANRLVLIHMSDNGSLSINFEPVRSDSLATRLSDIYSAHPERILYLSAEQDVSFQQVADLIDIVENSTQMPFAAVPAPKELRARPTNLHIEIRLVTPGAVNTLCHKGCYNWGKQGAHVEP
jgi:hypothetical protein